MARRSICALALAIVAAWLWSHRTAAAGPIRLYHMPAQKDSVGRRLPSARFGVSPGDTSRRNPCPSSTRRCTWLKPWIRASRKIEYQHSDRTLDRRRGTSSFRRQSTSLSPKGRANATLENRPFRLYSMPARTDSVGRRLSSSRYGGVKGRGNPCPPGSRSCRWMKPWVRASRSHEYPHLLAPKTTGNSPSSRGWTLLPAKRGHQ